MSESEHSSTESSSEGNEAMSGSDGETTGGLFVFQSGNFAPYQGKPLATANNADDEAEDEEKSDEDGILL